MISAAQQMYETFVKRHFLRNKSMNSFFKQKKNNIQTGLGKKQKGHPFFSPKSSAFATLKFAHHENRALLKKINK